MEVDEEVAQLRRHLAKLVKLREWSPRVNWRLVVSCKDEETLNLVRNSIPYSLQHLIAAWKVAE